MIHYHPISPLTSLSKGQRTRQVDVDMMGDLAEEELDPKRAVVDEPIVGEELVTLNEHGPRSMA